MINYVDYKSAPLSYNGDIKIFDKTAFEKMHKVGAITAQCLDELADFVKIGITTKDINNFVMEFAKKNNVIPATLNYRGYKYSCCTSLNHVICHGMPSLRKLQNGDIINIDVTFILDGWHGDSSRMYPIGKISKAAEKLLKVTYECLMIGIEAVKIGGHTGDIGHAIAEHAHKQRFSVVEEFCGHGIGQLFHDAPNILHIANKGEGIEIKEGMIFTIEPMINFGKAQVKMLQDGWTAVTKDKSLSAQYEHTIGVTANGCEIFTRSPMDRFYIK